MKLLHIYIILFGILSLATLKTHAESEKIIGSVKLLKNTRILKQAHRLSPRIKTLKRGLKCKLIVPSLDYVWLKIRCKKLTGWINNENVKIRVYKNYRKYARGLEKATINRKWHRKTGKKREARLRKKIEAQLRKKLEKELREKIRAELQASMDIAATKDKPSPETDPQKSISEDKVEFGEKPAVESSEKEKEKEQNTALSKSSGVPVKEIEELRDSLRKQLEVEFEDRLAHARKEAAQQIAVSGVSQSQEECPVCSTETRCPPCKSGENRTFKVSRLKPETKQDNQKSPSIVEKIKVVYKERGFRKRYPFLFFDRIFLGFGTVGISDVFFMKIGTNFRLLYDLYFLAAYRPSFKPLYPYGLETAFNYRLSFWRLSMAPMVGVKTYRKEAPSGLAVNMITFSGSLAIEFRLTDHFSISVDSGINLDLTDIATFSASESIDTSANVIYFF